MLLALASAITLAMTGPHQWGDVPTWVATIGTLGSFWVALAIYYATTVDKRYAPARLVSVYTVWSRPVARSQGLNVWNGQGFTEMPKVEPQPIVRDPEGVPPELAAGLVQSSASSLTRTVGRVKFAIENSGEHAIHHIRIDQGFPESSSIRPLSRSYLMLRPHGILRPVFHFEEDLNLEGLRPRVYFTDAMNRRWCAEPGYSVRPVKKGEGVYEGTGSLDFLNEDLPAHEGAPADHRGGVPPWESSPPPLVIAPAWLNGMPSRRYLSGMVALTAERLSGGLLDISYFAWAPETHSFSIRNS